jgi:hypothetical protein
VETRCGGAARARAPTTATLATPARRLRRAAWGGTRSTSAQQTLTDAA